MAPVPPAPRALVVAVGNDLRRDDGVAHRALHLLPRALAAGRAASRQMAYAVETRAVVGLAPELAAELAGVGLVVFVDADVGAARVRVEPVAAAPAPGALGHACAPAEVVALAAALYGFAGRALVCRVPVADLSAGAGLSERAGASAVAAAEALAALLTSPPPPTPSTPPPPAPR